METAKFSSLAKGEATKRLIAQLVNEKLVAISLPAGADQSRAHITGLDDTTQWMTLPVAEGSELSMHFRPNDFGVPVKLCSDNREWIEDDPGSIFAFAASWFRCDERTKLSIVDELRNSASMLEMWMELGSKAAILDINSSFIDWERSLIAGHPIHPFHRTCFANHLLSPVTPDDIPNLLNPGLSFVSVSRSSVRLFGPFDKFMHPLLKLMGISAPSMQDDYTVVPCLSRHLPALLHFFPEATLVRSVDCRALAQASIRTVSVPGFTYDLKLSLACLITSGLRVLPCYSAEAAPAMTRLLKGVIPQDLWLCGEVAAVTGSQPNTEEAQYVTCILRENLESRAEENNESLILVAALLERPRCGTKTYAEILFNLKTIEDKVVWLKSYLRKLLALALDPVVRHGVAFEFHAQNAVARVCRRTKVIQGFAIRDLGGVKMHRQTLESQGLDLTGMDASLTDDVHDVWDRTHHVLIQNHIGYLIYSLGLEREHDGWQLVFSELERALEGDGDSTSQKIFQYLVKRTMPFKAFMRMRMESAMSVNFNNFNQQIPNLLWGKSPWLRQISRSATTNASIFVQPQQTDQEARMAEARLVQKALLRDTEAYGKPFGLASRLNPHPMVLPRHFLDKLERFHEALNLALINIIDRWWNDDDADFPSRIPLDHRVEKVLRWVARGSEEGHIKPYKGNQGNLRPDILIPQTNGYEIPEFRLCEINGRFPENYLLFTASTYQALASGDWNDPSIKPATDHNKLLDSFFQLFDPSKPIHLLKESLDVPSDTPLYGLVEQRTGFRPRCIKPSFLRLVPCSNSSTGFELYCQHDATVAASPDLINVDGELLERVHQVGLQLFDFELLTVDEPMIQEIAKRSVNDLRSVFIAHDKRILGIIRQELDALVDKQIITRDQAELLRDGIIPTILPGSAELQDIIKRSTDDPKTKDNFIIKPFRLARGSGIMRGKSISINEWQSILEGMEAVDVSSSKPQYLLQPLLPLQTVEWFWDEDRQMRKSQMVGTYFSVNGRFVGLGQWRTGDVSEETVSAATKDVTLVLSVVYDKDV